MNKASSAAIIVGVAVAGFFAGRLWSSPEAPSPRIVESKPGSKNLSFEYQAAPPKISTDEARSHRDNHYQEIQSVNRILELPTDFSQTEALYVLAGRANAAELQIYIRDALLIADRYERSGALHILFSRYVELDPEAAVTHLLELDLDIDDHIIGSTFRTWAKDDTNGAIAMANQIGNVRQRKLAGSAILVIVARNDPGMLETVEAQLADRHNLGYLVSEAIGNRANFDPRGALQDAINMTNANGKWEAVRRVGIVWGRNDPANAIKFANEISNQRMRAQFTSNVFERWFGDDPENAMQSILDNPDPRERSKLLQQTLGLYSNSNPAMALELASQLDGTAKATAYQQIFTRLAVQDPELAMQAIASLGDDTSKRSLLSQMSQSLVSRDPEAALRWADSLASEYRKDIRSEVLLHLAQVNPRRALEVAINSEPSEQRQKIINQLVSVVGRNEPQLAMQFIANLPPGEQRDEIQTNIASSLSQRDPQAALDFISTLTGKSRDRALGGVAQVIGHSDPMMAASLIAQLPLDQRSSVIQNVAVGLAYQNPTAALTWLEQFGDDPAYDAAAASIAPRIAQHDPNRAMRIAAGIGGNLGESARENVLRTWAGKDPASAERWVRNLRDDKDKDRAFATLVTSNLQMLDSAPAYIGMIRSDRLRDQTIKRVYAVLYQMHNDTVAANEFLNEVDASDEVKQELSLIGQ